MRFRSDLETAYWSRGSVAVGGRARVHDVSREGMRVGIAQALPAGESVEFTLQVPGDNVPVFATGEVAWAGGGAALDGMGIRFRHIKPLDLARVLDYLYARWLGA